VVSADRHPPRRVCKAAVLPSSPRAAGACTGTPNVPPLSGVALVQREARAVSP
jgi:hypothetical protein